ncbi:MAG: CbtA family protein [Methylococcales bacterium]
MPLSISSTIQITAVKQIILTAALSGLLAGLLLTVIQQFGVMPSLFEAEVYEQAMSANQDNLVLENTASTSQQQDEWEPEEGLQRTALTAISNISLAFGFAMLLGAAMHLYGKPANWRTGILWGLAGYTVFFLSPGLGLPPEVPGTEAAALQDRQLWWLMTVLATGAGLSLLIFSHHWLLKLLGALLLATPHLIGAPQPVSHVSAAPLSVVNSFIYASAIANALFWLALGGLQGLFLKNSKN